MRPTLSRRRSASSPLATKARLRPLSGTTSATVPSATMSSQPSRSGSGRASVQKPRVRSTRLTATTAMNTRPTAARWPRPDRSSSRLGLTTIASGSRSSAWWWSSTMTSRPSRRASASGSMLAVPQSTVTSSVAPRLGERADRLDVGAVAFENPVGDVHDRLGAAVAQEARQQRRGGRAVDVVVAEDRDLLAAHHGVGEALRRLLHRGDGVRIGHQPPHRRIEERLDLVGLDAAAGQDARQQLRNIVPLRDGQRARRRALVEPVPPRPAANRALDAEEQPRRASLAPVPGRPS